MKIFAIGNVFNPSGVSSHIINVLKGLSKLGEEVTLYVPHFLVDNKIEILKDLEKAGVQIYPFVYDYIQKYKSKIRTINYFIESHTVIFRWNDIGADKVLLRDLDRIKPDIIYDMHEDTITLRLSYYLGKKLNVPVVKLLHDEPFRYSSFGRGYRKILGLQGFIYDALMSIFYKFDKRAYEISMEDGILRGIAAVSYASIYYSKLDEIAKKYHVAVKVYEIGNAFDKELIFKYRRIKDKGDYAVFFARLVPQKGLMELPKIAERLSTKIIVFGKLFSEKYKKNLQSKNIEYRGYKPIEEVYDTVSKAKVLIYPSHQDGYSLVVLDTLALGTSVVAYDIPAIRFVYGGLKPVKMVKEYDYLSLAKVANEVLSMPEKEYTMEHEDEKVRTFIEKHSDWLNVAIETRDFLKQFTRNAI
ncbi:glycosyltransferase family 4 protein [Sulfurisphaera ohwakuensis]|uniref:glycosyltransferase family 4 protein n=1 Tax=Sulfurisphaera ohwakuensis TaxID=69656 RepID=UPI0036F2F239